MANVHICLAADEDVAVLAVQVGEQVEGEDYRAICAVLERHNATVCAAILYRSKDVLDRSLWCEGMCVRGEGVKSCLD